MPDRIDIFESKGFKAWLEAQIIPCEGTSGYFGMLMTYIKQHRNDVAANALQPGDTELLKGEVRGLDWVLELPQNILADTETETDDVRHGNGNG